MKSLAIVKLAIVLLLCNFCVTFNSACQSRHDYFQENLQKNRMGDITGNVFNSIVREEDKFYYVNETVGKKIYSIFVDGTGKKKLNNCESSIIGLKDGWIYYNNISQKSDLYKMKIDGKENEKLSKAGIYAILYGDCVYYLFDSHNNIYRTKIDGSVIEKITNDYVFEMQIVDDWIYYVNRSDGGSLYKIKVDGTGRAKLNNVDTYCISIYKDWVVFLNYDDNQRIYRVKTDGTNFSGIVDYKASDYDGYFDEVKRLTISGEWIYFCNPEFNRVKFDKISDRYRIGNSGNYGFTVNDNWIYFVLEPNLDSIARVNIDGTTVNPQSVY